MAQQQYPEDDPRHIAVQVRTMLNEAIRHLRSDVGETEDPRAKALFETTAEVLNGLVTAYDHFESGSEEAWR